METTLNRDLAGGDVPAFSFTGIAHTFRNSPFNEYPYAMARLRWFTDSFDPARESGDDELSKLRAALSERAAANGHFTYLQVSDAGFVDAILDEIYRKAENGDRRMAREFGPHEPGIGRWVNGDEFNERHSLELDPGIDRLELFDRVSERLREQHPDPAAIDDIYLYPPDYGDEPGGSVLHIFRIFGHSEADDPAASAAAGERLRVAVETVLEKVSAEAS